MTYLPGLHNWDFIDNKTSVEQNPSHEYLNPGKYTVTLAVTDDNDTVAVDITWELMRE